MVRLSKNFTLQEFTKSQTAERKGIDNTPAEAHLENAKILFEKVVQPVRDHFGPTIINSGYRGPDLNYAIGGSNRSQHCKGPNYDVAKWIEENCEFDQLILEFYKPGIPDSGWVHVSYNAEENRRSVLTALKENGKTVYKPGLLQ